MAEPLDLRSIARRPLQYWNADGLPEVVMGVLWILWGGAWLVGQSLPRQASNVYWMLTPALLVLSGLAATWAIKTLKARITFPRTGYVEWQAPTRGQRLLTAAAAAIVAAGVVALVVITRRSEGLESLAAPGLGIVFGLGFAAASLTQRAPHLLVLAGVAVVLGLALGAWHAGWAAMNWLLVALGAATTIVGALRLRMFLLRNPIERHA